MVRLLSSLVFCLAAAALAAALGWYVRPRIWPAQGAVPGLKLGGAPLIAGEALAPQVERRARALAGRRVHVTLMGQHLEATLEGLGVSLDVPVLTRRAESIGRRGALGVRWAENLRSRRGELDLPLSVTIDLARTLRWLLPKKQRFDQPGRPARFDLAARSVQPDEPGRYLDLDRLLEQLRQLAVTPGEGALELVVPVTEVAPRVSRQMLEQADISRVVAEFSTLFGRGGDADNRARNIEVAASHLDGVALAPGELVSFNTTVGARTLENGFKPGWEIYRGEMVRGVGGGTCQVASTLHAAAFKGGLDVVERYPHSRPSGYIPLGMDATVSWPAVDLKLRNPWPFPLAVHAYVEGNKLTVQLLGREQPAEVALSFSTLGVYNFKRKVTESSFLPAGKVVRKQRGVRGYQIRRTRTITPSAGDARVEVTIDRYPPTPEHYIVPAGADLEQLLPPPPEGAGVREPPAARLAAGSSEPSVPPR